MSNLIIPVYLNQRAVFDLVAMLQDGIATVTRVSEEAAEEATTKRTVGSTFGVSNALSTLLKIDLSAERAATSGETARTEKAEERVHTPASLFYKLRQLIQDREHLKLDSETLSPAPGDFIEFTSALRRNPLLETLDSVVELLRLNEEFNPSPKPTRKKGQPSKRTPGAEIKALESFASGLKGGETTDLTTNVLQCGYRSVITIETQYLNDPAMSDLADGTFSVLGKVIRSVDSGKGAISLLRKSAISRLPEESLQQMKGLFEGLVEKSPSFPKPEWKIEGPVLQVLPVAIYA